MRVCVFCKTRYRKGSGVTFHKFPTDNTKKLWVKNMKFVNWSPKRNAYLCSKHFTDDCFIRQQSHTTLARLSVPTIFSANQHSKRKSADVVTPKPSASGTIDVKRQGRSDVVDSESDSDDRTDVEEQDTNMSHPSTSDDTEQSDTPKRPRTVSEVSDNVNDDNRYDSKSRVQFDRHVKREETADAPTFLPGQRVWSVNYDANDWSVRACRVCLAVGVKLRVMAPLNQCYRTFYALTEGCHWAYVCCECLENLFRIHKFHEKCLRTNALLENMLQTEHEITQAAVELIDREENKLESQLKMNDIDYWETVDANAADILNFESDEDSNTEYIWHETDSGRGEPLREFHATEFLSMACDNNSDEDVPLKIYSQNKKEDEKKVEKSVKKTATRKRAAGPTKILKDAIDCYNKSTKLGKLAKKRLARAQFFSQFADKVQMTREEAQEAIAKRKEGRNYKLATYKCDLCFKGFWEETSFKNHMLRHDPSQGEFKCEFCHVRYGRRRLLLRHVACVHTWKFCCRKCPNVCSDGSSAERHEAWHNGTQYRCKHCAQEFSRYTSMMNHVRIKHATESFCQLCGMRFVGERGVRFHMFKAHGTSQVKLEDGGHTCEVCDITFATLEALKRHRVVSGKHNLREEANGCEVCGEIFPTREDFQQHHSEQHARSVPTERRRYWLNERRKKVGLPPLEDADLAARHTWSRRKKYSKNTNQNKPETRPRRVKFHVCEVCGKVFQSAQGLAYHFTKHTGERPFNCDLCPKTFVQKALLQAHTRTHTNEKPYKCDTCDVAFSQSSNLKRHIRHVHSEVKPIRCEICCKMLKNSLCHKDHVKHVHMKVPYPVRRGRKRPVAKAKESDAD